MKNALDSMKPATDSMKGIDKNQSLNARAGKLSYFGLHCALVKKQPFVDVDSYFSILTDRTKGQYPFAKWLEGEEKHLPMYPKAASRKVKIYSRTEVSKAQGLEKIRGNFWNRHPFDLFPRCTFGSRRFTFFTCLRAIGTNSVWISGNFKE